jgi:hypothetical protein
VAVDRKRASAMTEPRSYEYTVQQCLDTVRTRRGTKVRQARALFLGEALNQLLHPEHCAAGSLEHEQSTPSIDTGGRDAKRRRNRIVIDEI